MQSSNPLPSCSVEIRFTRLGEFDPRVEVKTCFEDKIIRTEVFHKDQLFLACEPMIRDVVKQAVQRIKQ